MIKYKVKLLFLQSIFVFMKHKGSISQIYITRDKVAVPCLYREAKTVAEYPTTFEKLFEIAAELPVQQFYLSDDAAIRYIRRRMYRNHKTDHMSPYKRRLFESLYDIVCDMMKQEKYRRMGLAGTTVVALMRPAPCIGLTPKVIRQKYLELRKKQKAVACSDSYQQ